MIRTYLRSVALLLGVLLGGVACEGDNAFTDLPVAVGDEAVAGAIRGQVTANGIGVGGVEVLIVDGPRTVTNSDGVFRFANLAATRHFISITVPAGFDLAPGEPLIREVVVDEGRVAVANWRLQARGTLFP